MTRLLLAACAASIIGALLALGVPPLLLCVVGAVMACFGILAVACQPAEDAYPAAEDDF